MSYRLYHCIIKGEILRGKEVDRPLTKRKERLLLIVWTQSLIATLGSLYFSEILGYIPCTLCWFQRIFMYPILIISTVALLKKNITIAYSTVYLSGIGLLFSIYHYGLQKAPFLGDGSGICGSVPCNLQYINYFGFVTIPFLAGVAFVVIFVSSLLLNKEK